ncbi:thiaminase II [Luedemannella flava]|uniref:Aminopyrimidine aminohydrolase n=1 Tax=Luedemannella flava TaxID=349316 RepID=A0ABP4Y2A6_9ACTN
MVTTALRPSLEIRDAVADTWRAQFEHPFVLGLADGSLPAERFAFFLRQDYGYLREYSRFLLLTAARATDLEAMRHFTDLARITLNVEMATLRGLAAGLGVGAAELDAVTLAPTARAYTDFLVRTAYSGSFVELVAAMLPCYWAYTDIGQHLLARPEGVADRYRPWIESYVDPEMLAEAEWCRVLLDRLVSAGGDADRAAATAAFRISTEYELAFWEMAWRGR